MSYSDSDEHSGSEAGENRNSSVNTRVIKQHRDGSKELKGVFREDYESDSNQKPRRADKTHYQLNEQRVNNGKHNKGSYHGSESDSFDSDSSELADVSHDQDSREYRKKDRKISSYDNLKDTYKNEARQTDRDDIMNSHEDRKSKKTSDFNETLTVDDNRESRKMNQVRARRPEERNGEDQSDYKRDVSPGRNRNLSPERGRDVSPGRRRDVSPGRRRDVSPGRRRRETTRNIEKPNVIITEADVHVDSDEQENKRKERSDKEEYERRRRKEKSDSHLHVAHRNEPEMYDKPGRTRSEPRIAGKHGKDEVNRADKREYRRNDESQKKEIVENEAHTNDSIDEMWEKDNNFEYQDRNTHNRGNRDQNDRREHDQKEITDNESRSRRNREHNQAEVTEDESRSTARNESKSRSGNNKSNDKSSRKEYENKAGDFKRDRQKEELQGKKYNEHEDEPMNRSRNNKFEGDNSSRKEYEAKKDKRDGHNREYQDNRTSDHDKVGLVERDTRGNNSRRREHLHKKEVSYEDETDGGQYDNSAVKNEKRKEPNTRYYTPQMKRKQNKGRQGALLSLVSEDDLSDSGSRQKGFEKSRNTEAAFSPVGKAKSMKDVRTSREPSMDNEFSMPHNKMGSFQDFKPMAKATSVSRISNIHDGPLSLQDAHGAGMEPNDTSQSAHRALSTVSNHLSESSQSLGNQIRGISQSPSKSSSIVRQQSVQSEVNGEQREEGIKFERLKNLQEDDLLVKVKEIVGHLEKLEDYHRGDGMRVQKMLGDMYWDYTAIRETVGDCMADCGYAVVSMKMLKTLNGIGIFKNDDVWFPTYYTYNTMWNFTDASNKLAQALADNDAVRLLTLNCGHKPYINAIHSKNVYYVMKASLSILHNIARNSGMKHLFDENKTSETIMPFLESEDEMLKILATLTIANIVDEEENKTLITDTGTIKCIVSWMEKALNLARRRYKGFTPQELTEGLNRLAVNDSNKMKIIEEGALPLFLKMLQHDDVREQSSAARIIWTLSFDKDVRQKIKDFPELVPIIEKLTESTNKSLQTNTTGALWVIRGDNDVSRETRPKSAKSKTHVFLSYSWSDKETVLTLRDRLRAEGYAIWIDIEKMGGSTLEGMAGAVENSAVVLVCMSEKYKQSPNCRTEAEYTFQLRKDYIPLMMQKKYRPDGWLGIVLGAKLYFDFSGKYPFDKSFQGLLKELRGRGKVTPGHTPGDDQTDTTATIMHSQSLSSHASLTGTPTHQFNANSPVLNMGQEELIKWLRNIKLTECIPAFMEFDGRLLMQLKVMREEAPEFFYSCLEKRLNMSLIEILKFTRALEELH